VNFDKTIAGNDSKTKKGPRFHDGVTGKTESLMVKNVAMRGKTKAQRGTSRGENNQLKQGGKKIKGVK